MATSREDFRVVREKLRRNRPWGVPRIRPDGAPEMKEASPRYAVTSPRWEYGGYRGGISRADGADSRGGTLFSN